MLGQRKSLKNLKLPELARLLSTGTFL